MSYEQVLDGTQMSTDFAVSGEQLLIFRHVGTDYVLSLLTPEDSPVAIPLRTFTENGEQRMKSPKGTFLRLSSTQPGAFAWLGKVYADAAGDLL